MLLEQFKPVHQFSRYRLLFLLNHLAVPLFYPLRFDQWQLLMHSRPRLYIILFRRLTLVTPKRHLLLAHPVTVYRELLLLLQSLRLNMVSECLKGLLDVLFLLTAQWLIDDVEWVTIELQLDFELVFVQVGGWDCLTRLWLLTVVPLRGTALATVWIGGHCWGRNYYLIV